MGIFNNIKQELKNSIKELNTSKKIVSDTDILFPYHIHGGMYINKNLKGIKEVLGDIQFNNIINSCDYVINDITLDSDGNSVYSWIPNIKYTLSEFALYHSDLIKDENRSINDYNFQKKRKCFDWMNSAAFDKNMNPKLDSKGVVIEVGSNLEYIKHIKDIKESFNNIKNYLLESKEIYLTDKEKHAIKIIENTYFKSLGKLNDRCTDEQIKEQIRIKINNNFLGITEIIEKELKVDRKLYTCNKEFNIDDLKKEGLVVRKLGVVKNVDNLIIQGGLNRNMCISHIYVQVNYEHAIVFGIKTSKEKYRAWDPDIELFEVINNTNKDLTFFTRANSKRYVDYKELIEIMEKAKELNINIVTPLENVLRQRKTDIRELIKSADDFKTISENCIARHIIYKIENENILSPAILDACAIKIVITHKVKKGDKTVGFKCLFSDRLKNIYNKEMYFKYGEMITIIEKGVVENATIVKSDSKKWHIRCTGDVKELEAI